MIDIIFNDENKNLGVCPEGTELSSEFLVNKWISLINPDDREIEEISSLTGISEENIKAALDEEERARIDKEDDCVMILLDVPLIEEDPENDYYTYGTIPMSIIHKDNYLVTVCLKENSVVNDFKYGRVKNVETHKSTRLTFQLLYAVSTKYLYYLRLINKASQRLQSTLEKSMKNNAILEMLDLQKSLVYFSTSISANDAVIEKLNKQSYLKKYDEDQDVIEDASIENKQAAEMCSIYREIMNGTMEAYGTIISNNVNDIMKFLTALTLVISVPTLVASLFGMNLGGIPWNSNNTPWGFGVVCAISFVLAVVSGIFLAKKKMF
ncbi:MAG: magnesium transporter CorA family protein [Clostridia bacterium]|nr:magnesium transporter CorA family protein [Clostridia bacterium]